MREDTWATGGGEWTENKRQTENQKSAGSGVGGCRRRSQRVNALGRRAGPIAEAFDLECVGRTCHLGNRHALAQVPGSRAGNAGSPFASSNEQSILGLIFGLRKSATYSVWPNWAPPIFKNCACFGTECAIALYVP